MTKILYISIILLLFNLSHLYAQQLDNYNLYSKNDYLYNPAFTMQSNFKALLNLHYQWLGFEGAPEIRTFGIYGPVNRNMAFGLNIVNQNYGAISNFRGRLSYAYKAKFSEKNILLLGTSFGFLKTDLKSNNLTTDVNLNDPLILENAFNKTSLSASAGLAYRLNNFEFQFVMPQILEQNHMNFYSIGIVSYTINLQNEFLKIKPLVLIRGASVTPKQFEANLMAEIYNRFWIQAGYSSNKSMIFSGGISFESFDFGYAYQMDNSIIGNVSNGSHEVQLVFNFGKNWIKDRTTTKIKGEVTNKITKDPLISDVIIHNNNKTDTVTTNDSGKYKTELPIDETYNIEIKSTGFNTYSEEFALTPKDKTKTLDAELMPTYTTLNGTSNIPNAKIDIYEQVDTVANPNYYRIHGSRDSLVYSGLTDENNNYQAKLKPGKIYKIEVTADNYNSVNENFVMPTDKMEIVKETKLNALIKVNGKVINIENSSKITGILRISKADSIVFNKAVKGTFACILEEGEYIFEVYGSNIVSHKEEVTLAPDPKEMNVVLKVIPIAEDRTFKLGSVKFVSGKAVLTEDSYLVLDELVSVLNTNPSLKIEIGGHTDDIGDEVANLKISQERADACKKYLKSKGIDSNRVVSIGYGESVPLVPNNNAQNRAKNRRTEFKIIE